MTKPVPSPSCVPSRPVPRMTTTDFIVRLTRASTDSFIGSAVSLAPWRGDFVSIGLLRCGSLCAASFGLVAAVSLARPCSSSRHDAAKNSKVEPSRDVLKYQSLASRWLPSETQYAYAHSYAVHSTSLTRPCAATIRESSRFHGLRTIDLCATSVLSAWGRWAVRWPRTC